MIKIIVLSFGVWVSNQADSMTECQRLAQRIFQLNPDAQVWCCDSKRCVEQEERGE